MRWIARSFFLCGFALWGLAAVAQERAEMDRLFALIRLDEVVAVMRDEGLAQVETIFGEERSDSTDRAIARLYDREAMEDTIRQGFAEAFGEAEIAPLIRFFDSPSGREIVEREIAARILIEDDEVERIARRSYREQSAAEDSRLTLVARYVEVNDLVNYNVAGALNANYHFYRGLAEGGALRLSEEEILAEVSAEEEAIRYDTEEWLMGYLLLAYRPLKKTEIEAYVALSRTPAGQAFNQALFAGFGQMYEQISHGLGLALAHDQAGDAL